MNTVILTGSPWSGVEQIFDHLEGFGLERPADSQAGAKAHGIRGWHDQLFSSKRLNQYRQIQLGKAWEQSAGEVFMANWGKDAWGWADSRSTWLLDFWRDFDPNTRFVLVHVDPELALAQAMSQVDDQSVPFDVNQVVATWLAYEQELLRFHLRNPQRSLLVDYAEARRDPVALVKAVNESWGSELVAPSENAEVAAEVPGLLGYPLAGLLAGQALKNFSEAQSLNQEIATSLKVLSADRAETPMVLENSIEVLRKLIYDTDVVLSDASRQCDEQAALLLTRDGELQRQADELKEHRQKIESQAAQSKQLEDERDEQIKNATQARQENELLLLQLHQVQEELEQYFLKAQTLEAELLTSNAELTKTRALAEERRVKISQLDHELGQGNKTLAEYNKQIQDLLGERNTILVREKKAAEESQAKISQLERELGHTKQTVTESKKQIEDLLSERSGTAKSLEDYRAQIQQLQAERDSGGQSSAALREENELLLLQLHQVQEELEHYFLQYQQEQKQREQATQRLERLFERWPDFVDMGGLRVMPGGDKKTPEIVLTATGVYHAARSVDEFTFKVRVENKMPAIVIERGEASPIGPLLRWPAELVEANAIVIPAKAQQGQKGSTVLASSDWRLLQALSQTCSQALQNGAYRLDEVGVAFNPAPWQAILAQLSQELKAAGNCLRYDSVKLKRKKVNPDYEYLWLQCRNLSFNGKQWPLAEFRFSASAVKRQGFSIHPKLEFSEPESGEPLFENWRPDLEDDYGPKMEFRCETQSQAVDIGFWNSLTDADKALLLALVWQMPVFLTDLETQQVDISRPWQDWQQLAADTMATIKARVLELGIV